MKLIEGIVGVDFKMYLSIKLGIRPGYLYETVQTHRQHIHSLYGSLAKLFVSTDNSYNVI